MAIREDFLGSWRIVLTTNDTYGSKNDTITITPKDGTTIGVDFAGTQQWDKVTDGELVQGLLVGTYTNGQSFGIAFQAAPECLPAPKSTIVFIAHGPKGTGTWTGDDDGG